MTEPTSPSKPTPRKILLVALAVVTAWSPPAAASPARAQVQDRWTQVCPGIRHLHRTTDEPVSIHVAEVNLLAPGISIEVTPWEQRWLRPSQFGRASGAVVAINGGFWSVFDAKAEGLVMHGGRRWPGARDDEFYGFFAIDRRGRAMIRPADEVWHGRVSRLREAISGLQRILHRGRVTREAYCADGCRFRQPRTAVGVDASGAKVWLVVVDGRRAHSRGLGLPALGRLFRDLGATEAINLDGGGSAAMYLATARGLVNQPAERREREVLNHIAVFWRPTRAELATYQAARSRAHHKDASAPHRPRAEAPPVSHAGPQAAHRPGTSRRHLASSAPLGVLAAPPRPNPSAVPGGLARWVHKRWREILSPRNLAMGLPVLLALVLIGIIGWRRRRARRESPSIRFKAPRPPSTRPETTR